MSPTLFVLCIDILIDKLTRNLPPTSTLRAFADDIGLAIQNRSHSLPIIAPIFHQFGKYSSLHLFFLFSPVWCHCGSNVPVLGCQRSHPVMVPR